MSRSNQFIIHDLAVIAQTGYNQGLALGEARLSFFYIDKDVTGRLERTISELIAKAQENHQQNTEKLNSEDLDYITRLTTNENFFYTNEPLSLTEFEILMNKINPLVKDSPHLHFILSSFAIKTNDNRVMNVTCHISGGSPAKYEFIIKNFTSDADFKYRDEKGGFLLPFDRKTYEKMEPALKLPQIKINNTLQAFSFFNLVHCKSRKGKQLITAIDICHDYREEVAKKNWVKQLEKDARLSDLAISHVVVGNTIYLDSEELKKSSLETSSSSLLHVDSIPSNHGCRYGVNQIKSELFEPSFGNPYLIYDIDAVEYTSTLVAEEIQTTALEELKVIGEEVAIKDSPEIKKISAINQGVELNQSPEIKNNSKRSIQTPGGIEEIEKVNINIDELQQEELNPNSSLQPEEELSIHPIGPQPFIEDKESSNVSDITDISLKPSNRDRDGNDLPQKKLGLPTTLSFSIEPKSPIVTEVIKSSEKANQSAVKEVHGSHSHTFFTPAPVAPELGAPANNKYQYSWKDFYTYKDYPKNEKVAFNPQPLNPIEPLQAAPLSTTSHWQQVEAPLDDHNRLYSIYSENKKEIIGDFTETQDEDEISLTVSTFPGKHSSQEKAIYACVFILQCLSILILHHASCLQDNFFQNEALLELDGNDKEEVQYLLKAWEYFGLPLNAISILSEDENISKGDDKELTKAFQSNSLKIYQESWDSLKNEHLALGGMQFSHKVH